VPELPLVVDSLQADTTKGMISTLNNVGLGADLTRARRSKRMRPGQGKMRTTRFTFRKGPLVVYGDADPVAKRTARNLPGVDTCHVSRLNLLQLAPGGHIGRLVVFTQDSFKQLDQIFGTYRERSVQKSGFQLGRPMMSVADLARIINSDQVQSKLREERVGSSACNKGKKNPLTNKAEMQRINPAAKDLRAAADKATAAAQKARAQKLKAKRSKAGRKEKAERTKRFHNVSQRMEQSFQDAHQKILDEEAAGKYKVDGESEEDDE
jgi:large subunit ribosomal protein L4e